MTTAEADPTTVGDECLSAIFLTPEGIADPNPFYHRLRDVSPVHHSGLGMTVLTRYDDCRAMLRDNNFSSSRGGPSGALGSPEALEFRLAQEKLRGDTPNSLLFLDPPDHTRLRGLVSRAFTPRTVDRMRADIVEFTEEALDGLAADGGGDVMDHLAFPIPVAVIAALVGVPRADTQRFRSIASDLTLGLEPAASLEDLQASAAASSEMWAYFTDLLAKRRDQREDDLISALIDTQDGDDRLTDDEIIVMTILLFAAGFETTTNLIGNAVGALLRNPDQLELLWGNPDLVAGAVEEVLRWDSPVQLDGRTALPGASVGGATFNAGDSVLTLLGAANRDPAVFDDPDRFDITRTGTQIMSFSSGIHYCLGANLARVEGQEVVAGLIRRFSTIEQAGDLVQRPRMTLRGYEAVEIAAISR